jgi:hypothetical protein
MKWTIEFGTHPVRVKVDVTAECEANALYRATEVAYATAGVDRAWCQKELQAGHYVVVNHSDHTIKQGCKHE